MVFILKGVHVKLEKMAKHPQFDEILNTLRLQVRLFDLSESSVFLIFFGCIFTFC